MWACNLEFLIERFMAFLADSLAFEKGFYDMTPTRIARYVEDLGRFQLQQTVDNWSCIAELQQILHDHWSVEVHACDQRQNGFCIVL